MVLHIQTPRKPKFGASPCFMPACWQPSEKGLVPKSRNEAGCQITHTQCHIKEPDTATNVSSLRQIFCSFSIAFDILQCLLISITILQRKITLLELSKLANPSPKLQRNLASQNRLPLTSGNSLTKQVPYTPVHSPGAHPKSPIISNEQ